VDDFQNQADEVDRQLQELSERSEQLFLECKLRSAQRVSKEAVRMAKGHGRVIAYMHGLFDIMRFGHGLLDPQSTREAAVELVVLLQNEEQARRIQPDLDEGQYSWICTWMSSCAYDNLAEATGLIAGYNSAGMHECINEGIQVCRQTGKTECIKCFREYASDVYLAGDDLAMVRHQCQTLLDFRNEEEQRDRRWAAHQKLGWVNLLEGRLIKAQAELESGFQLATADKVYQKIRSSMLVGSSLDEVLLLSGKGDSLVDRRMPDQFDPEEWPRFQLDRARVSALQGVVNGDLPRAIEILTDWDQKLTRQKCLKDWFEIRLRLIAAYLIAGKPARAEALGKGLEARAEEAQDHLTMQRWKKLMQAQGPICPIPLLKAPDVGPCQIPGMTSSEIEPIDFDDELNPDEPGDVIENATPLAAVLADYMQQIVDAAEDEDARREIMESILEHLPQDVEDANDAAYLVHLSRYVAQGTEDALKVWDWATRMRSHFAEDAVMLSVTASLGHYFRHAEEEVFHPLIPLEDLEQWIRLSLSLNPNHPRNYARAGQFFLDEGMHGDAEQCFARAFRLDRTDGNVAHRLADLYRETERPRDALAVLDICLRKGTQDSNIAWAAAMTALQLQQYDMLLTYLDRYLELNGNEQAWFHYYRGLALFRLGQHDESLQELDYELTFSPPGQMHLHVIRTCALHALGRVEDARQELESFLNLQFVDVDYLSLHGLVRLAETLCDALEEWPEADVLRQRAVLRLLRAGLISDEYLYSLRSGNDESEGVHFYRVQLRQPLDSGWKFSEGCLSGQELWEDYLIDWGVLARSDQEAVTLVLEFQNECESAVSHVVKLDKGDETFRERIGVVWQGYRRNEATEYHELSGGEA